MTLISTQTTGRRMDVQSAENPWYDAVTIPFTTRAQKPRTVGLTMVIDKGEGVCGTKDLLDMCAPFVDYIKLGFGTSALYPSDRLREKVELIRSRGVDVYPGGTLLELARVQGRVDAFIGRALEIGFTCLEVSEGTVELDPRERASLIGRIRKAGLRVVSEVGKKDAKVRMEAEAVAVQAARDLDSGAELVIVEGRDSGIGVGAYDDDGAPREALVEEILARVDAPDRLMWEAPLVDQQKYWIGRLGADVNLGNVQTADVMSLEATRVGLRGDTLKAYVRALASHA